MTIEAGLRTRGAIELTGFKTFVVGLGLAILPQIVTFVSHFDFVHAFGLSPNAASVIGIVMVGLRAATSTPIFQGKSFTN